MRHPVHSHINTIETITFFQEPTQTQARYRCVHVFGQGHLDRSPGGAGTAAMLCLLEARGELKLHEAIQAEGILGAGTFEGSLVGETAVGGYRAVQPTIKGRAEILGNARWLLDPSDRVAAGFLLS